MRVDRSLDFDEVRFVQLVEHGALDAQATGRNTRRAGIEDEVPDLAGG
jgi:hypothetical protein